MTSPTQMTNSSDQPKSSAQDQVIQPPTIARYQPLDQIVRDLKRGVQKRTSLAYFDWINVMHEEVSNFIRNEVWELVEAQELQYDWNQVVFQKQAKWRQHSS